MIQGSIPEKRRLMNLRILSLVIIGFATGFCLATPGRAEATTSAETYESVSKEKILLALDRIEEAYPQLAEGVEVARKALDLPLMTDSGSVDGVCRTYDFKTKDGTGIQIHICCSDDSPCYLSHISVCWKKTCQGYS